MWNELSPETTNASDFKAPKVCFCQIIILTKKITGNQYSSIDCYLYLNHWKPVFIEWLLSLFKPLETSIHWMIAIFISSYITIKQVSFRFRKMWSHQYSSDDHISYYNFLVWDPLNPFNFLQFTWHNFVGLFHFYLNF